MNDTSKLTSLITELKDHQDDINTLINECFFKNNNESLLLDDALYHYDIKETLPKRFSSDMNFYDYIGSKVKIFAFQRLLHELLILHAYNHNDYIPVATHTISGFDNFYVSDSLDQYAPLNEINHLDLKKTFEDKTKQRARESHEKAYLIANNPKKVKKADKDKSSKTMEESIKNSYLKRIQITLNSKYHPYQILNSSLSLLHWRTGINEEIPDIYSVYLNIFLHNFEFRGAKNYLSKANDVFTKKNAKTHFKPCVTRYNEGIQELSKTFNFESINHSFSRRNMTHEAEKQFKQAVYSNYLFLINNIIANNFFRSFSSSFCSDLCNSINLTKIKADSSNTFDNAQSGRCLNLLELLMTFDINTFEIDKYIDTLKNAYDSDLNETDVYMHNFKSIYSFNPDDFVSPLDSLYNEIRYINLFSDQLEKFKRDLHDFLISSIKYVFIFCENWFTEIEKLQKENYEEDIVLIFINCIQEILFPYISSENTFSYIPYSIYDLALNQKISMAYLLYSAGTYIDIYDRFKYLQ